jgi:hypothetical protein
MQLKKPKIQILALQALVIFGGGHLITHGPLLIPWENPPVSEAAYYGASVEWGILGVLIVSVIA